MILPFSTSRELAPPPMREQERIHVDPIDLEKDHGVIDLTGPMTDFNSVESTPPRAAYSVTLATLNKDTRRQILTAVNSNCYSQRRAVVGLPETPIQTPHPPPPPPLESEIDDREAAVEYLKASAVDGSPLSPIEVECYFANFGPLLWCRQVDGASTVGLSFRDPAIYKTVFDFHHRIERRPIRLVPVRKNGMAADRGYRSSTLSKTGAEETSLEDLSRVMERINELAGSVAK